jgi:hypothetical protein
MASLGRGVTLEPRAIQVISNLWVGQWDPRRDDLGQLWQWLGKKL